MLYAHAKFGGDLRKKWVLCVYPVCVSLGYRHAHCDSYIVAIYRSILMQFSAFFTARAYARTVLGVGTLSVCLSHACIVTKLNDTLQIFLYHTKGQSLCYQEWLVGDAHFPLKSAFKVTHPLRKTPTSTDFCS